MPSSAAAVEPQEKPAPGRAQAKADRRKAVVLRAAARLFSRKTYLDTTMDEIAEAARVSKGGLYYYFDTKSEVLFHIMDSVMDDLLEGLDGDLAAQADGHARLRRIIERQIGYYSDHLAEVQTLLNDRHCLDRRQFRAIEAKQERYFAIVRNAVAECLGAAGGAAPPKMLSPLAFALFGMCNWIPGWYRPGGAVSTEQLIDMTYQLFLNGLGSFGRTGP